MNFEVFRDAIAARFVELAKSHDQIFEADLDKDALYAHYLASFPDGTNPIFRVRQEYDCSCCRHFIRDAGAAVFINDDLSVETVWKVRTGIPAYDAVAAAMDNFVKDLPIKALFFSRAQTVGTVQSHERLENGDYITWPHFYAKIPRANVCEGKDIPSKQEKYRANVQVFKRSLTEISDEALDIVHELIRSNTLYKGQEWEHAIQGLEDYKARVRRLTPVGLDRFVWLTAGRVGPALAKIRNHSIGVLLTDLSNGMDVDSAVTRYEKIVAPANYKRPKAIFTKKMLEDAKKTIDDLGYMESLPRRFATLDDITVNNILFSNRDAARRIGGSVFNDMLSDAKVNPKRFERVEEIPAERFISDVLPGVTELEAYVENRHVPNMVSLIAPVNANAPTMFKWNNPFSWAYAGNITDSDVKQNVKAAGGRVDGVLRFSIQWNDTDAYSGNDLDAHCEFVGVNGRKYHIYFGNKGVLDGGNLDVDITHPRPGTSAVENITWPELRRMNPGEYKFFVHQYAFRGGRDGFRAEIEFDGQIFKFDYRRSIKQDDIVPVAIVTLDEKRHFSIQPLLQAEASSRDIWGIKTMNFVPVTVAMFSPNYWDEQQGIGHKHYFFMLKDCVNPESPNGFYNEFLKQELADHKRVFEALGGKMAVQTVSDQLSGLGFSSTKRNTLVVKVKAATERTMKILF